MLSRYTDADIHNLTALFGDAEMRSNRCFPALPCLGVCVDVCAKCSIRRAHQARDGCVAHLPWRYSGRRFSTLAQINQSNVKHLTLAWIFRIKVGITPNALWAAKDPSGRSPNRPGVSTIKAYAIDGEWHPLFSTPDNAWAVDARSGREIWHYAWKTKGGVHIGNRGMGMYGSWLFFETPDTTSCLSMR